MEPNQLEAFLQEFPVECLTLIKMVLEMDEQQLQQLVQALEQLVQGGGQGGQPNEQQMANENLYG